MPTNQILASITIVPMRPEIRTARAETGSCLVAPGQGAHALKSLGSSSTYSHRLRARVGLHRAQLVAYESPRFQRPPVTSVHPPQPSLIKLLYKNNSLTVKTAAACNYQSAKCLQLSKIQNCEIA